MPVLLCLTYFSERSVLKVHRCCRMCRNVPPSSGELVPRRVRAPHFVPSSADGPLRCLCLSAVVHNATFYQDCCTDYVAGTQSQGGQGPLATLLTAGLLPAGFTSGRPRGHDTTVLGLGLHEAAEFADAPSAANPASLVT